MNWFLLLFFIPLVLVPIVLLCGFAGCAQIADLGSTSDFPPAPSNLIAKTAGASRISLIWTDNSGGTANFVVLRSTFGPDGSGSLSQIGDELVGPFFIDTGLAEGTDLSLPSESRGRRRAAVPGWIQYCHGNDIPHHSAADVEHGVRSSIAYH